ncbi:unnamed protein product, partial [Nesidiocoris tenuis]
MDEEGDSLYSEGKGKTSDKTDKDSRVDKVANDGMIDIDDEDDYLLYLEPILERVHRRFYRIIDKAGRGALQGIPWRSFKAGCETLQGIPWRSFKAGCKTLQGIPWRSLKAGREALQGIPWRSFKAGREALQGIPWRSFKAGREALQG